MIPVSLRIAMIAPHALQTKGGPSTYVKNLSSELTRRGHEVVVLAPEAESARAVGVRLGLPKVLNSLGKLATHKPRVVHVHNSESALVSAWLYRVARNRSARVVFTFHTMPHIQTFLPVSPIQPPGHAGFRRAIVRPLLGRCDALTAVSHSIVAALNEHSRMGIDKYSVIPSAGRPLDVDAERLERIRRQHCLDGCFPILCTVGVMVWDSKVAGQEICIEAVDLIRTRFPKVKLLIAGDGPYRGYLEGIVQGRELAEAVTFLGNVDFVPEILALSDIYVHMALVEASPHAVIDAMWAGKPVIAANRGGIPEIIEDGISGILIEPSPERLAEQIDALLGDQSRREGLARNALAYAKAHLSWEVVASKYLMLYQGTNCV